MNVYGMPFVSFLSYISDYARRLSSILMTRGGEQFEYGIATDTNTNADDDSGDDEMIETGDDEGSKSNNADDNAMLDDYVNQLIAGITDSNNPSSLSSSYDDDAIDHDHKDATDDDDTADTDKLVEPYTIH
mmetsp:Transcript_21774/g.24207  ORF Transcript_21774/g.24207 Transcript_21774/m.24207 type:complete len:131 (+) Transcript_21774:316-708(+)